MNTFFTGNINKSQSDNERFLIRGYMSVPVVDLENEVIGTEAYEDAIRTVDERFKKGTPIPMFVEHRRKELSLPIGKVVKAGKDENGMWFEGEIAGGILGTPIRELIKGGYLYGCSIGGDAVKKTRYFDTKINKDVTKITKMQLRELSLTGLPVNEEAVFAIAKSQNKEEKEVRGLMKSLDNAIDTQKMILSLEKAVEPDNLDEESLNRIKEALNNLAKLLKIDTGEGAPVAGETETGTTQMPPKTEEEVAPNAQPAQPVAQPGKPAMETTGTDTKPEELPKPEEEEEEDMGIQSKLDEMSSKLDKLLGENSEESDDEEVYVSDDLNETEDNGVEETSESEEGESKEHEAKETPKQEKKEHKGFPKKGNKMPFKKKETMKSQNNERGENVMEILECEKCGDQFEKSENYEANFCPHCGGKVMEKSMKEEAEDIQKDEDELECEHCKSIFVKSSQYEASYCPKCGKSLNSFTVAVAPEPQGAKTAYKAEKEMPKGKQDAGTVAVAPSPKGASTNYEGNTGKETGNSVKQFGDGEYVDANPKEVTDKGGEDINESRPSGKKLLSSFNAEEVASYGKERVGKSLEERLEKIEKALETSKGRRSEIPAEGTEIEKSTEIKKSAEVTQEMQDQLFVSALFGKK